MQIAVIGGGLPGMMLSDHLASEGHDVFLIAGIRPPRTNRAIGPIYLWDTEPVRKYLFDVCGAERIVSQDRSVVFVKPHFDEAREIGIWSIEDRAYGISGYMEKMRSKNPPCMGLERFSCIPDGFKTISDGLAARKRFSVVMADLIKYSPDGIELAGEEIRVPDSFDKIVSTIDRGSWCRVAHGLSIDTTTPVFYYPFRRDLLDFDFDFKTSLMYIPSDACLYFRMSYDALSDTIVHESLFPSCAGYPPETFGHPPMVLPGKILDVPVPKDPPHVFHIGRWAEMDEELLISDVIARLDLYAERILE